MKNVKLIFYLFLCFGVFLILAISIFRPSERGSFQQKISPEVYSVPLKFNQKQLSPDFSTEDVRQSSFVVINFWASWCVPCRDEHPILNELKHAGIQIYGVNRRDDVQNAIQYLESYGNPYARLIQDETGHTAVNWGVIGVPETFIVQDGIIKKRIIGPLNNGHRDEIIKLEANKK